MPGITGPDRQWPAYITAAKKDSACIVWQGFFPLIETITSLFCSVPVSSHALLFECFMKTQNNKNHINQILHILNIYTFE